MSPLIAMPFDEAARLKYKQGVEEHRPDGGDFVGDPYEEAYMECLDKFNYYRDIERRGRSVPAFMWAAEKASAAWIKEQIEARP